MKRWYTCTTDWIHRTQRWKGNHRKSNILQMGVYGWESILKQNFHHSSRKPFLENDRDRYRKLQLIKMNSFRSESQWMPLQIISSSMHSIQGMLQKRGKNDYSSQRIGNFAMSPCFLIIIRKSHQYDSLHVS